MDYEIVKLKEIADFNKESIGKNSNYEFINYLDTANITNGAIDTIVRMPIEEAPSRAKRVVHNNDMVYSTVRPNLCHYGILDSPVENMIVSTGFTVISCKDDVNPYYVYNYLTQNDITSQLHSIAENSTSAYPSIKPSDLESIEIKLPKLDIQNKIAKILTDIDKKIKINNEINNNLSEQLKTIFNDWFESKMSSGLPDNWKIVNLQEVSTFSQGVQVPIEEQIEKPKEGFVRFIRIVDITQGSDKEIRYIEDRDRGHVIENEIFMTRYGTPGIISRNYNGIIANNLFKITPSNDMTSNYLYSALSVDRIQKYIRGNATSSTMPAISFSTLNNQKIIIPDCETLEKFDKYSETIREKQLNITNENNELQQLRDTLLPKLMNGEIDLDNIEI